MYTLQECRTYSVKKLVPYLFKKNIASCTLILFCLYIYFLVLVECIIFLGYFITLKYYYSGRHSCFFITYILYVNYSPLVVHFVCHFLNVPTLDFDTIYEQSFTQSRLLCASHVPKNTIILSVYTTSLRNDIRDN